MPIELITKVVVLAEGALWKEQMVRIPNRRRSAQGPSAEIPIVQHILDIFRILFDIGIEELREATASDGALPPGETELAQRITATFRRTLPALRIANKWLRANLPYIVGDSASLSQPHQRAGGRRHRRNPSKATVHNPRIGDQHDFWLAYATFVEALSQTFPSHRLPALDAPLEEDIDMRAFLPLRKLMFGESGGGRKQSAARMTDNRVGQAHPNIEQLMRIRDLLDDARNVAEAKVTCDHQTTIPFTLI
jgi:protein SMG7